MPVLQTEVNYPSISTFSGSSQLNIGPWGSTLVNVLLRAQVRGKVNFQGASITDASFEANTQLWCLQWVPQGDSPLDIVSTSDGPRFLIRRALGSGETRISWAPDTDNGAYLATYDMTDDWAGQQRIGANIDVWLSLKPPTGASVPEFNLYGSVRWWWY